MLTPETENVMAQAQAAREKAQARLLDAQAAREEFELQQAQAKAGKGN